MTQLEIRTYRNIDQQEVIALWRECGLVVPWNDPVKDIQRKLEALPELFLVGSVDRDIVGTVMAGYDGHRGWINYLAVSPRHRKQGYGRILMDHAKRKLEALGCPKINLQVRSSNSEAVEFYRRLGFEVDDVVSMGKRLEKD